MTPRSPTPMSGGHCDRYGVTVATPLGGRGDAGPGRPLTGSEAGAGIGGPPAGPGRAGARGAEAAGPGRGPTANPAFRRAVVSSGH